MRILSALWVLALGTFAGSVHAQEVPRFRIHVAPGIETPLGAWRADYANAGVFRVLGDLSLTPRQYVWGDFTARFGGGVRNTDQILGFLVNEDGYIIGNDGSPALVRLEGRGSNAALGYGYRAWMKGPHSAAVEAGGLLMSHKIWFNNSGGVPMLTKPYVYGLDRLRRGLGLQAALRYSYFDALGTVNFSVALRGGLARTDFVRGYYYGTTNQPFPEAQWDGFLGLEATWYLPLAGRLGTPEGTPAKPNQPKVRYYQ